MAPVQLPPSHDRNGGGASSLGGRSVTYGLSSVVTRVADTDRVTPLPG